MTEADDYAEPDAAAWDGWVGVACFYAASSLAMLSASTLTWVMAGHIASQPPSPRQMPSDNLVTAGILATMGLGWGFGGLMTAKSLVVEYRNRKRISVVANCDNRDSGESP